MKEVHELLAPLLTVDLNQYIGWYFAQSDNHHLVETLSQGEWPEWLPKRVSKIQNLTSGKESTTTPDDILKHFTSPEQAAQRSLLQFSEPLGAERAIYATRYQQAEIKASKDKYGLTWEYELDQALERKTNPLPQILTGFIEGKQYSLLPCYQEPISVPIRSLDEDLEIEEMRIHSLLAKDWAVYEFARLIESKTKPKDSSNESDDTNGPSSADSQKKKNTGKKEGTEKRIAERNASYEQFLKTGVGVETAIALAAKDCKCSITSIERAIGSRSYPKQNTDNQ